MPRDTDGNFTLPAGNPVVTDTVISSDTHNTTQADVAQGLTDSLDRNGRGGMAAPLPFADGTVTAPGVTWTNERNTGLYRAAPGTMIVASLGNTLIRFSPSGGIEVYKNGDWRALPTLTGPAQTQSTPTTFTNATITNGSVDATAALGGLQVDGDPVVAGDPALNQMVNPQAGGMTFRYGSNIAYNGASNPTGKVQTFSTAFPTACLGVVPVIVDTGTTWAKTDTIQVAGQPNAGSFIASITTDAGDYTTNVHTFAYWAWGY